MVQICPLDEDSLLTIMEESPESDLEDSTATAVSYAIMPRRFGGELFMVSHNSVAPEGETSAQRGTRKAGTPTT